MSSNTIIETIESHLENRDFENYEEDIRILIKLLKDDNS
jgi:hypothetical protein